MQRCGLCSLLSRLLRRAMCVGSRRGSGESYYQELAETTTKCDRDDLNGGVAPEVATMETSDSSVYIRLIPASSPRRMSDSDKDRPLLEALIVTEYCNGQQQEAKRKKSSVVSGEDEEKMVIAQRLTTRGRHACNGRFLTMHKRRRKKLTTRSLLQDVAILDDILHGQVQCILNQVHNWRFNAFTLETVTGGRSLPVICVHLFHWYGLLEHFKLDVVRLWKLFTLIEEGYHSTNPYHNAIHATDVTQAMHCFLQETKIHEHLEPLEIMASLIGAVTHDLDHPGVNQPFLIATSNHLAALYENTSVLENHHWRSAVGCLLESGVAEQIQSVRPEMEKQISSLILATDITRQQEFLTRFRGYLDTKTLDLHKAEHRHFILQIALKCADISNPCRPWDVSKKWSQKVCEEFFRQGDYERQLNLPITSLCDRFSTSVPKIQVGFFKFVVTPLFDEWHRFLDTGLSRRMMKFLKYNQVQWENRVAAELAEETKTEISDADILDQEDDIDLDLIDEELINKNRKLKVGVKTADDTDGDEEERDDIMDELDDDLDEFNDTCIELSNSSEVLLPHMQPTSKTSSPVHRKKGSKLEKTSRQPRRSSLQVPKLSQSRFDRRHSVPVNTPKIIILSTCDDDTDEPIKSKHTNSGSTIQEDVEIKYDDSFSILSSDSDSLSVRHGRSSGESNQLDRERPLSAETLVPDLSIATMTDRLDLTCANRLNLVMHGGSLGNTNSLNVINNLAKQLVRQQTFPPLQSYPRTRYLSSAADLGQGSGTCRSAALIESNSSSSDTTSSHSNEDNYGSQRAVLVVSKRRESKFDDDSDKSSKIAKLTVFSKQPGQKENMDPSLKKSLARRRGSAPVGIATSARLEATTCTGHDTLMVVCHHHQQDHLRRGSMPNPEFVKTNNIDLEKKFDSMPSPVMIQTVVTTSNTTTTTTSQTCEAPIMRRSSMPYDSLLILGRTGSGSNGKAQRNRKKILRRRSSGGTEILNPILTEESMSSLAQLQRMEGDSENSPSTSAWYQRFKKDIMKQKSDKDALLSRRRGSLPIEVLAVGHSGTLRH